MVLLLFYYPEFLCRSRQPEKFGSKTTTHFLNYFQVKKESKKSQKNTNESSRPAQLASLAENKLKITTTETLENGSSKLGKA